MTMQSVSATAVSPWVRFQLREVISHWNRALDAQDIEAMAAVSVQGIRITYESEVYEGTDAMERFAAVYGSGGHIFGRHHVNQLQAHIEGSRTHARSMAMVTQLVPATSPFGAGAASVGWVGYVEDVFVPSEYGPLLESRRFRRWGGGVLSRFPREKEEQV